MNEERKELEDMAQKLLDELQAYEDAGGNAKRDLPDDYKLLMDTLDLIDELNKFD